MSGTMPVAEISFALKAHGGLERLIASGAFPDLDSETAEAIIEEAERFAEDQLAPLNHPGDRAGVTLADGVVTTPPGWKETYTRWREAGWNGLGSPPEWGGQGLPMVLQMALQEIWNSANAVTSAGIQVHGGAGYIEETGAAQLFRDARIFAIYEGTNGIQAMDLATRKVKLSGGAPVAAIIKEVAEIAAAVAGVNQPEFGQTAARLADAGKHLAAATAYLAKALAAGNLQPALAGATPYLRLFALAFGGALLAKGALGADQANRDRATALARFHAESLLGEAAPLAAAVIEGAEGLQQAALHLGIAGPTS